MSAPQIKASSFHANVDALVVPGPHHAEVKQVVDEVEASAGRLAAGTQVDRDGSPTSTVHWTTRKPTP